MGDCVGLWDLTEALLSKLRVAFMNIGFTFLYKCTQKAKYVDN